jgi:hypothetical protein
MGLCLRQFTPHSRLVLLMLLIRILCRLNRSLYGLKQAPRVWYSRFASFLLSLGFVEAKSDVSLVVYCRGDDMVYLLLYVDDIVRQLLSRFFFVASSPHFNRNSL